MKDNRKIKKTSSLWRSRGFCIIATTPILWVWGDIAQPQATNCQVGTYDCAGPLYLSNSNVGIGTTNPRRGLHIENADPRILAYDTDAPISATRPAWEFGQSGSSFVWRTTPDYSTFSGDVASITPEGNLAIAGRMTGGTIPLGRMIPSVATGRNTAAINLQAGVIDSRVVASDALTVAPGDLLLIQAQVSITKGSIGGTTMIRLTQGNAMADILFFGGQIGALNAVWTETNQPANTTYTLNLMGIATVAGTNNGNLIIIDVGARSDGSNSTISISNAQIVVYRIQA